MRGFPGANVKINHKCDKPVELPLSATHRFVATALKNV